MSDNAANSRPPVEELEAALTAQMREQYLSAPDDHISSGVAWLTVMYTEAIAPHLSRGSTTIEPVLRQLETAGRFRH